MRIPDELFVHVGLADVPLASVDVEELDDVDVLEEVLQDRVTRLMAQVHDRNASPDQKTYDNSAEIKQLSVNKLRRLKHF